MDINKKRLEELLEQYHSNTIAAADCEELFNNLSKKDFPYEYDELLKGQALDCSEHRLSSDQEERILRNIKRDQRFKLSQRSNLWKGVIRISRLKIAAAVLMGGIGLYFFLKKEIPGSYADKPVEDASLVQTGGKKATLKLANGELIALDNSENGVLVDLGEIKVSKTDQGQLIYESGTYQSKHMSELVFNELSTPRGGEYQVRLPDGTKVWLNASSTLSYPVEFIGKERRVKIVGEAYFEVAKDHKKPFFVEMPNGTAVKVLGTHFNISAYKDDSEYVTTLLEGAVEVSKDGNKQGLKPGQQATVNADKAGEIYVESADINAVMAWKNGYFVFNEENIEEIMKKVARWYDVDVEYSKVALKDQYFGGTFSKHKKITELLSSLEKLSDLRFTIAGRRIIVMK